MKTTTTNKTEKLTEGQAVSINGRTYEVTATMEVGENTRRVCPWLSDQYMVQGKRGALGLLQTFTNGSARLIHTNGRTETTFSL